jgi:hypothetical protein
VKLIRGGVLQQHCADIPPPIRACRNRISAISTASSRARLATAAHRSTNTATRPSPSDRGATARRGYACQHLEPADGTHRYDDFLDNDMPTSRCELRLISPSATTACARLLPLLAALPRSAQHRALDRCRLLLRGLGTCHRRAG